MAKKRKAKRRRPAHARARVSRPRKRTRRRVRSMGAAIAPVMGARRKRRKRSKTRRMSGNPANATPIIVEGVSMARRKRRSGGKRRRARSRVRYMGGAGGRAGGNIMKMLQTGGLTVVGAGIGSMVAARVPMPDPRIKPLIPVAAGLAIGATKLGRQPLMQSLALGMIVAGGLALGRQFAPQFFAGEDEMLLGVDESELLGIPAVSGEDELLGIPAVSGEDEDVFAGEDFATSADF